MILAWFEIDAVFAAISSSKLACDRIFEGYANTVTAVVSFITPFIAGTIAQNWGYRPLFVVSLLMAFCALYVTLRYFPKAEVAATT